MEVWNMLSSRRLLLLAIGSVAVPIAAAAQGVNPFRGSKGTPLKTDDLKALGSATTKLLDQPQLSVGASESWSNPVSGIAGTVTAGRPIQRHGLACRMTDYAITGPGKEPPRKVSLTWCKTQDGWKAG
jgi:surface antigen